MNYYQAYQTFDYLMKNTFENNEISIFRRLDTKGLTIENFIKECITVPLRQIYVKTCSRFMNRLKI